MNSEKMLHLTKPSADAFYSLLSQTGQLEQMCTNLNDYTEQLFLYSQIVNVFNHYDLGNLVDVSEIFGGYVNRSFRVITENKGKRQNYFLRMYKPAILENELLLEHSLIDFSICNGLDIAAGLIRNRDQKTFVKLTSKVQGKKVDRFFAVYDFLPGEDKYTWDDPDLNDEEYASVGGVLATFHNASRNFDPKGRERVEPKIMELMPMLPGVFREFAEHENNNKFHKYYLKNINEILEVIQRCYIPPEALERMPLNPIHSDFHPGNLKFQDNKVVGIFDFDWCKIDLRIFDVSLAMVYTCCSWQDEKDGTLLLDKCKIFLDSYQKTLKSLAGLNTLNETELEFLPSMLGAANIYLINWSVMSFYSQKDNNVYEYLAYLKHNVRLMKWIEGNREELLQLAKSVQ